MVAQNIPAETNGVIKRPRRSKYMQFKDIKSLVLESPTTDPKTQEPEVPPQNQLAVFGAKFGNDYCTPEAYTLLHSKVLNCGEVCGYAPSPQLYAIGVSRPNWPITLAEVMTLVWPDRGQVFVTDAQGKKLCGAEDHVRVRQLRATYEKKHRQYGLQRSMLHGDWVKIRNRLLESDTMFRDFYLKFCFFKPMCWIRLNNESLELIKKQGSILTAIAMMRTAGNLVENGCYYPQEKTGAIQAYSGVPYAFEGDKVVMAPVASSNLSGKFAKVKKWGMPFAQAMARRQESLLAKDTARELEYASKDDKEEDNK
jgi:hypothetical protein